MIQTGLKWTLIRQDHSKIMLFLIMIKHLFHSWKEIIHRQFNKESKQPIQPFKMNQNKVLTNQ